MSIVRMKLPGIWNFVDMANAFQKRMAFLMVLVTSNPQDDPTGHHFRTCWYRVGTSWTNLDHSRSTWNNFGPTQRDLDPTWNHIFPNLAPSRAQLRPTCTQLGPNLGQLGAKMSGGARRHRGCQIRQSSQDGRTWLPLVPTWRILAPMWP